MRPDSPNKVTRQIELDGQLHTLAVDLNFYRVFQQITGRDLLSGEGVEEQYKPNANDVVALMYAALRSGNSSLVKGLEPQTGMDVIGGVLHPGNVAYALDQLRLLMSQNSPEADQKPESVSDPFVGGIPVTASSVGTGSSPPTGSP